MAPRDGAEGQRLILSTGRHRQTHRRRSGGSETTAASSPDSHRGSTRSVMVQKWIVRAPVNSRAQPAASGSLKGGLGAGALPEPDGREWPGSTCRSRFRPLTQPVCLSGPQCFQPPLSSQTEVMDALNAFSFCMFCFF